MIRLLDQLPDNVIGIVASATVDARDYETIVVPAVEARLKSQRKLRLLYELGADFEGFTAGAMWDDTRLGLGHLDAWERIAVVTDIGWITRAVRLFALAIPCPVRAYANADRAEAEAWIAS